MLSSVKGLVITALLLLSGTAVAAPAAIPSPAPAPVPEIADLGTTSNEITNFQLTLFRFKGKECKSQVHMAHEVQSEGKCSTFRHAFKHFAVMETAWLGGRKPVQGNFGPCTMTLYVDKHCQQEVSTVDDIHSVSQCGHVSHGSQELRAHSVKVYCEKDGKGIEEVEVSE